MYEKVFKIHAAAYIVPIIILMVYKMAGLYEAQGILNMALDAFQQSQQKLSFESMEHERCPGYRRC